MLLRQCVKTRADVVELIDFAQDRLKRHGHTALSLKHLSRDKLQMDWLSSEDLKRGEGGNHPGVTIARQKMVCLLQMTPFRGMF
jgi:hypothetical protein